MGCLRHIKKKLNLEEGRHLTDGVAITRTTEQSKARNKKSGGLDKSFVESASFLHWEGSCDGFKAGNCRRRRRRRDT